MSEQTNPRTVYETGGSWVISLPKAWARQQGIELGDNFVLEETDRGFLAIPVEWSVSDD